MSQSGPAGGLVAKHLVFNYLVCLVDTSHTTDALSLASSTHTDCCQRVWIVLGQCEWNTLSKLLAWVAMRYEGARPEFHLHLSFLMP